MFRELVSRGLFYKKNSAKTKMSKGTLSGYFTFSAIEKGKNSVLGRGKSCLVGVVFFSKFRFVSVESDEGKIKAAIEANRRVTTREIVN